MCVTTLDSVSYLIVLLDTGLQVWLGDSCSFFYAATYVDCR